MDYNLVILVKNTEVLECAKNYKMLFEFLPIKKVVYLGNGYGKVENFPMNDKIEYFNGEEIIPYATIEKLLEQKSGLAVNRTGWYLQQFLKFAYAYVCDDEYYIVWDSDSWPIKKMHFFDDKGRPIFGMKYEYHKPYFDTMKVLFPEFNKCKKDSFICAHMVFNVNYVKEMLMEIERNTSIEGDKFYEKIISAINVEMLPYTGFSEFETFGTYICYRHPDAYSFNNLKIDRYVSRYFTKNNFDGESMDWMAKDYSIVCFEGWCKYNVILHFLMSNKYIHERFTAEYIAEKILNQRRRSIAMKEKCKDHLRPIYRKLKKKW